MINGHELEDDPGEPLTLDLGEIADRHPVKRVRLPADPARLYKAIALGDIEDVAEEAGVTILEAAAMVDTGQPPTELAEGKRIALGLAMAWVIIRREVPGLTFATFKREYMLEPSGAPPDPRRARRSHGRRSTEPRSSSGSPE